MDTWKEHNPDFSYQYFGQQDRNSFMASFQNKGVADIYFDPHTIQTAQADIFRACIMYEMGGIYVDSDLVCLGKVFDSVRNDALLSMEAADHSFYLAYNGNGNIGTLALDADSPFLQNHFLAAQPKHKYFEFLFEMFIRNSAAIISGEHQFGQIEIGLHEVGPAAWCQAFKAFCAAYPDDYSLMIDVQTATHSGLFIDIGAASTWNDGPLTETRLRALPIIFARMLRGGVSKCPNQNRNVGSIKFHTLDGHGNAEYAGSYGF